MMTTSDEIMAAGTRLEVFWPDDDTHYPGRIAAHHHNQVYTIEYTDGLMETRDLSRETWRRPRPAGEAVGATDLLGARVEVYWPGERRYYPGVVDEHHWDLVYTIRYDDGDVEREDLATAKWRRPPPAGGAQQRGHGNVENGNDGDSVKVIDASDDSNSHSADSDEDDSKMDSNDSSSGNARSDDRDDVNVTDGSDDSNSHSADSDEDYSEMDSDDSSSGTARSDNEDGDGVNVTDGSDDSNSHSADNDGDDSKMDSDDNSTGNAQKQHCSNGHDCASSPPAVIATKPPPSVAAGDRLSIYWPDYKRYYSGVVVRHARDHVYEFRYDAKNQRGERVGEVDLAQATFRRAIPTPAPFHEGSLEVYRGPATWAQVEAGTLPEGGPGRGWRQVGPEDALRFYACSLAERTCEVEWEGEGAIHATCFREMGARKRRPVDRMTAAAAPPPGRKGPAKKRPPSREAPLGKKAKVAPKAAAPRSRRKDKATGDHCPTKAHYVTETLHLSPETVMSSLPRDVRNMFNTCCWVPWEGLYRPALCVTPFDLGGSGGIVKKWTDVYRAHKKAGTLLQMPHLVYWYEEAWKKSDGHKAFSLVCREKVISYDDGIAQGWDEPPFLSKVRDPSKHDTITEQEDKILVGIYQMKIDHKLPSESRGGPMFFPNLREVEKKAADDKLKALKKQYDSWTTSSCYEHCLKTGNVTSTDTKKSSLELCAGTQGMSNALKSVGFDATTLDSDPKLSTTSSLSLGELERIMINGNIRNYAALNRAFSVVWAAPECRTWSIAQNGRYRNQEFIDGFRNRPLDAHARQARQDIESLVNILSHYRRRNPHLVMVIENPEGYLQHHPVSGLFETVLGLTRVKISYCQFSNSSDIYPQKDTYLWTNSSILLREFGNKRFECCQGKHCSGKGFDGKHIAQVQMFSDRCSAYPLRMCEFIAPLLLAETVNMTFGHGTH